MRTRAISEIPRLRLDQIPGNMTPVTPGRAIHYRTVRPRRVKKKRKKNMKEKVEAPVIVVADEGAVGEYKLRKLWLKRMKGLEMESQLKENTILMKSKEIDGLKSGIQTLERTILANQVCYEKELGMMKERVEKMQARHEKEMKEMNDRVERLISTPFLGVDFKSLPNDEVECCRRFGKKIFKS